MSFFQEYSLLFAIAISVAVVALIEVALWLSGERGASLLPGLSRYPTVMSQAEIATQMVAAEPIAAIPGPELRAALDGYPTDDPGHSPWPAKATSSQAVDLAG